MRVLYVLMVALIASLLVVGFWIDNEIISPISRLWWLPLIAAYAGLTMGSRFALLPIPLRSSIAGGCGLLMLLTLTIFDDILTIYLCGATILFCHLAAVFLVKNGSPPSARLMFVIIVLIAVSLFILPVSINRVVVKLPNLSAGTYLTLHESERASADLSAQFFNRIDDHHELTVDLGAQLYFQQPHQSPLLRIDIHRDKIVLRILSIRYDTRLAFLHLPLFEISGESLLSLQVIDKGAPIRLQLERQKLLIDRLEVDNPGWVQLPHMDIHTISGKNHFLILLVRLIVWIIVCFGLISWAPTAPKRDSKDG